MIPIFLLITGVILLAIGAYIVVEGVIKIAKAFNISKTVIGLSIISIGTSLPEIATSIKSGLVGASGIAIGTNLGSDITQITLIMGIAAILTKIYVTKHMLKRDGMMVLLSILLVFIVGITGYVIQWYEGLFLVCLYGFYLYSMAKDNRIALKVKNTFTGGLIGSRHNNLYNLILVVVGIVLLIFASDVVVENAILLSSIWGVRDSFIGIMIIGVGSALPELSTAIAGIIRKQPAISVGTLIGSNITDPMLSLGLGAMAAGTAGLKVEENLLYLNIPFWFISSIVALALFHQTIAKKKRRRINGVILISMYAVFVFIKIAFFMH